MFYNDLYLFEKLLEDTKLINQGKKMEYIKIVVEKEVNEVEKIIEDDGQECVCGKVYIEEHTCPYAEEINNDCEALCTCCTYCCQQCAWSI